MGVFSDLPRDALAAAVVGWGRGLMVDATPTPLGIENSNYFVTTEDSAGDQLRWVLTVMSTEPTTTALSLLADLSAAKLPVAAPIRDLGGNWVGHIEGHPALLTPRLEGAHPDDPNARQCAAIGSFLGRMHRITRNSSGPDHPRDQAWLERGQLMHLPHLGYCDQDMLRHAVSAMAAMAQRADYQRLPQGLVHGDLFRDNAMMAGDTLTGVIDFHHAARAPLAFDLAVVAMDWCCDASGALDAARCSALLDAYRRQRSLTREEHWFWPLLLVQAALRFWIARLNSPRKPPAEMAARLRDRLARPMYLQPMYLQPMSLQPK